MVSTNITNVTNPLTPAEELEQQVAQEMAQAWAGRELTKAEKVLQNAPTMLAAVVGAVGADTLRVVVRNRREAARRARVAAHRALGPR